MQRGYQKGKKDNLPQWGRAGSKFVAQDTGETFIGQGYGKPYKKLEEDEIREELIDPVLVSQTGTDDIVQIVNFLFAKMQQQEVIDYGSLSDGVLSSEEYGLIAQSVTETMDLGGIAHV